MACPRSTCVLTICRFRGKPYYVKTLTNARISCCSVNGLENILQRTRDEGNKSKKDSIRMGRSQVKSVNFTEQKAEKINENYTRQVSIKRFGIKPIYKILKSRVETQKSNTREKEIFLYVLKATRWHVNVIVTLSFHLCARCCIHDRYRISFQLFTSTHTHVQASWNQV